MTDNLEFLPKLEDCSEHSASRSIHAAEPRETAVIELPTDVLAVLNQYGNQSGQTQTQVILEVLRSALGLGQAESAHPLLITPVCKEAQPALADSSALLVAEVEQLKIRLRQLEALIPKVEDLAGKLIAF